MKINDKSYKTIWFNETNKSVEIIDQTKLPHSLNIISLKNLTDVIIAIKTMQVRGCSFNRWSSSLWDSIGNEGRSYR